MSVAFSVMTHVWGCHFLSTKRGIGTYLSACGHGRVCAGRMGLPHAGYANLSPTRRREPASLWSQKSPGCPLLRKILLLGWPSATPGQAGWCGFGVTDHLTRGMRRERNRGTPIKLNRKLAIRIGLHRGRGEGGFAGGCSAHLSSAPGPALPRRGAQHLAEPTPFCAPAVRSIAAVAAS